MICFFPAVSTKCWFSSFHGYFCSAETFSLKRRRSSDVLLVHILNKGSFEFDLLVSSLGGSLWRLTHKRNIKRFDSCPATYSHQQLVVVQLVLRRHPAGAENDHLPAEVVVTCEQKAAITQQEMCLWGNKRTFEVVSRTHRPLRWCDGVRCRRRGGPTAGEESWHRSPATGWYLWDRQDASERERRLHLTLYKLLEGQRFGFWSSTHTRFTCARLKPYWSLSGVHIVPNDPSPDDNSRHSSS